MCLLLLSCVSRGWNPNKLLAWPICCSLSFNVLTSRVRLAAVSYDRLNVDNCYSLHQCTYFAETVVWDKIASMLDHWNKIRVNNKYGLMKSFDTSCDGRLRYCPLESLILCLIRYLECKNLLRKFELWKICPNVGLLQLLALWKSTTNKLGPTQFSNHSNLGWLSLMIFTLNENRKV